MDEDWKKVANMLLLLTKEEKQAIITAAKIISPNFQSERANVSVDRLVILDKH